MPTRNFIAINTTLLSGFGVVGALADMSTHADKVKSVKEQMAEILTPDAQMAQLQKADVAVTVKFPADTKVVIAPLLPDPQLAKTDAAEKAKVDAMKATDKAGKRLSEASATCYGELVVTHVFYQKAAMYGTRVFTGFKLRDFRNGVPKPKVASGQVQHHAAAFPAERLEKMDEAKAALLDTFSQNLGKWSKENLTPAG
jgi:hypothetical protein